MRYYQVTIRTMELPFQFFEVINERLFQGTDEGNPPFDNSSTVERSAC